MPFLVCTGSGTRPERPGMPQPRLRHVRGLTILGMIASVGLYDALDRLDEAVLRRRLPERWRL